MAGRSDRDGKLPAEAAAGHGLSDASGPGKRQPASQEPADGAVETEAERARTEIAAGDVADDLADFA